MRTTKTTAGEDIGNVPLPEGHLTPLLTHAAQEDWQEENPAHLTMLASEPVLRRLWDTPEEDEAWKDL